MAIGLNDVQILRRAWIISQPALLILAVTCVTWLLRGTLTLANVTMLYLLAVLVLAIGRGTRVALVAASISFLCINFFLVQPFYTFIVADPREVIDLIVFFLVAVLGGQLAARERQQAQAARQRAHEQEILYQLTRSFNQVVTRDDVYETLVNLLKRDVPHVRDALVLPHASTTLAENQPVQYILLQFDGRVYGALCVTLDGSYGEDQARLLNACSAQAAVALYRIELAERARKSQQFEEADRLKTALLHAVSHDLRTPITIIKTSASNLRTLDERLAVDERRELYESIEQEADRLDKLVGNLLDLSRLRAGTLTLNCQANSLEEIAGDAAAYAYQRTKQERIRLVFPDDFPLVSFDYGLMRQATTNLVDNALRYEPPGSQIELRGEPVGQEARLLVVNHGENITKAEREHLMEPFYHGRHGNTGLGLAIAKGIVEAHHGRLWVEDTVGGGATFVIALPLEGKGEYVD